jgi:hypothetical protein
MSPPVARFTGRFTPRTEPREFLARVERRVEAGFHTGGPHARSRYAVTSRSAEEIAIRSRGFLTDFAIGLNDISMRIASDGAIEYRVTFWRWLRGCILLSGVIGALLLITYWIPLPGNGINFRSQARAGSPAEAWLRHAMFWASVAWWGVAWPWVLAAFHRNPAEQFLRRILAEVDAGGNGSAPPDPGGRVTKPGAAA